MTQDDLKAKIEQQSLVRSINPYHTAIRVIGTGGAGNNTIHHLMKKDAKDVETIAMNTDAQNLLDIRAHKKILIGKNVTGGLGAGGDPMVGERAAEESYDVIDSIVKGTDLLFITCGLGGGTGTGSAPVIGKIAKEQGVLTVAVVTMPFTEEGIIRWENAKIGLEKLRKNVDTLILLQNDKLSQLYPDIPISEAFHAGDGILLNALIGISSLVMKRGLINLDFADISMVMRDGPNAVIGLGESSSEIRGAEAVKKAITHPMMEWNIKGAQSALIHISSGHELTLKEAQGIIKEVYKDLDPNARIIWGTTIEKHLKQKVKVMLIVSGLREEMEKKISGELEDEVASPWDDNLSTPNFQTQSGRKFDRTPNIFDIKESIMANGTEISTHTSQVKPVTQTTMVFYKIFEEEATGDLKRFDRAIHFLRENHQNRKALNDARQSCKLLLANAQMFGFDEIENLITSITEILACVQSREIKLDSNVLDSITLAMEMVVDLVENRSDGRGETGYIIDRLKELKNEKLGSKS